jgi:hypothetical protein
MLVRVNYHTFFSCLCTELYSYFKIDTVPIQLNQCRDSNQNLELIPMSENRSKSPIILNISEHYTKINGPVISLKNRDMDHARSRSLELTMAG